MEKRDVYYSLLLLKPTSMCSEHQNHLGIPFPDPNLVEFCKSYGKINFSSEFSTKTRGTPVSPANFGEILKFVGPLEVPPN